MQRGKSTCLCLHCSFRVRGRAEGCDHCLGDAESRPSGQSCICIIARYCKKLPHFGATCLTQNVKLSDGVLGGHHRMHGSCGLGASFPRENVCLCVFVLVCLRCNLRHMLPLRCFVFYCWASASGWQVCALGLAFTRVSVSRPELR